MAASTGGALKALLEAAGLGVPVFRDRSPEGQPYPHLVVHEAISVVPEAAFSQHDDPQGHVAEQAQIDLWERWRHADGSPAESYTLGDAVAKALKGATLTNHPNHVAGCHLVSGPIRLLEIEENLIHKAYTVELHRVLERS